MKRMHVHVSVADVARAVPFYSALFAAQPVVLKPDYAKWMLDDPRVNFAISMRGRTPGLDHLGIQVEDQGELGEVYARLDQAGGEVLTQGETVCCYAQSEKSWINDPAGISWETFLTTGDSTTYGDGTGERPGAPRFARDAATAVEPPPSQAAASSCCAPQPAVAASSCCAPAKAPV